MTGEIKDIFFHIEGSPGVPGYPTRDHDDETYRYRYGMGGRGGFYGGGAGGMYGGPYGRMYDGRAGDMYPGSSGGMYGGIPGGMYGGSPGGMYGFPMEGGMYNGGYSDDRGYDPMSYRTPGMAGHSGYGRMGYGGYGRRRRYCQCRKNCKPYEFYAGRCWWCRYHFCRIKCCRWY